MNKRNKKYLAIKTKLRKLKNKHKPLGVYINITNNE